MFQKGIIAIDIQMSFRIPEGSCIPVSFSINESIVFGKIQLVLNSVWFTTVPKDDSWEASTEDNTQKWYNI